MLARVVFDFEGVQSNDLPLKAGELVEVLDKDESGWWTGRMKGRTGEFPFNYVQPLSEEEAKTYGYTTDSNSSPTGMPARQQQGMAVAGDRIETMQVVGVEPGREGMVYIIRSTTANGKSETAKKTTGMFRVVDSQIRILLPDFEGTLPPKWADKAIFPLSVANQRKEALEVYVDKLASTEGADFLLVPWLFPGQGIQMSADALQSAKTIVERARAQEANKQPDPPPMLARVLYTWDPQDRVELAMEEGEVIAVWRRDTGASGWWEGQSVSGVRGLFPSNHVEVMTPQDAIAWMNGDASKANSSMYASGGDSPSKKKSPLDPSKERLPRKATGLRNYVLTATESFDDLMYKGMCIETPSGQPYPKPTTGTPKSKDRVRLTFVQYLWDCQGASLVDILSSNDPDEGPIEFVVDGEGEEADPSIVQGLMECVKVMTKGSSVRLVLGPSMGYGTVGAPPLVPPGAFVVFDLKMEDFGQKLKRPSLLQKLMKPPKPAVEARNRVVSFRNLQPIGYRGSTRGYQGGGGGGGGYQNQGNFGAPGFQGAPPPRPFGNNRAEPAIQKPPPPAYPSRAEVNMAPPAFQPRVDFQSPPPQPAFQAPPPAFRAPPPQAAYQAPPFAATPPPFAGPPPAFQPRQEASPPAFQPPPVFPNIGEPGRALSPDYSGNTLDTGRPLSPVGFDGPSNAKPAAGGFQNNALTRNPGFGNNNPEPSKGAGFQGNANTNFAKPGGFGNAPNNNRPMSPVGFDDGPSYAKPAAPAPAPAPVKAPEPVTSEPLVKPSAVLKTLEPARQVAAPAPVRNFGAPGVTGGSNNSPKQGRGKAPGGGVGSPIKAPMNTNAGIAIARGPVAAAPAPTPAPAPAPVAAAPVLTKKPSEYAKNLEQKPGNVAPAVSKAPAPVAAPAAVKVADLASNLGAGNVKVAPPTNRPATRMPDKNAEPLVKPSEFLKNFAKQQAYTNTGGYDTAGYADAGGDYYNNNGGGGGGGGGYADAAGYGRNGGGYGGGDNGAGYYGNANAEYADGGGYGNAGYGNAGGYSAYGGGGYQGNGGYGNGGGYQGNAGGYQREPARLANRVMVDRTQPNYEMQESRARQAAPKKKYDYQTLRGMVRDNVDFSALGIDRYGLEDYLDDSSFMEAFQMDKKQFLLSPKWRQDQARRQAGLA